MHNMKILIASFFHKHLLGKFQLLFLWLRDAVTVVVRGVGCSLCGRAFSLRGCQSRCTSLWSVKDPRGVWGKFTRECFVLQWKEHPSWLRRRLPLFALYQPLLKSQCSHQQKEGVALEEFLGSLTVVLRFNYYIANKRKHFLATEKAILWIQYVFISSGNG